MLHVAVGVIRDAQQNVLIALRDASRHQGGLWEFPGGKVESGETCEEALARELLEELGIEVQESKPLIQIPYSYADRNVFLDVREVQYYTGVPSGREGQPLRWVGVDELPNYAFPSANQPIINAITLPRKIAITGRFENRAHLLERFSCAVAAGADAILLRSASSGASLTSEHCITLQQLCREHQISCILHSDLLTYASNLKVDSLHLSSAALMSITSRPHGYRRVGASCHNLIEMQRAQSLGLDYSFLSAVRETTSHIGMPALGWPQFRDLVKAVRIPVYALGGVSVADFDLVRVYGGQGVAAISSFWPSSH